MWSIFTPALTYEHHTSVSVLDLGKGLDSCSKALSATAIVSHRDSRRIPADSLENLPQYRLCRFSGLVAEIVTELAQLLGQVFGAIDEELWFGRGALLDVTYSFVQDLRDQPEDAMCNGPVGG
jgi:hypothetical protein